MLSTSRLTSNQFSEPTAGENEVVVRVQAAALKPVDKQIASGSHYASPGKLPVVCGLDGVGRLEDGARVYFAGTSATVRRHGGTHRRVTTALLPAA